MSDVPTVSAGAKLTADVREFLSGMAEAVRGSAAATEAMQAMANKTAALESSMKTAAVAALAAFGPMTMMHMVQGVVQATAELKELSEVTGVSVEALSALKPIAAGAGRSIEEVARGVVLLSRNLVNAKDDTSAAGRAVTSLGLSLQELKNMRPEDAMLAVAQALDKFEDGSQKTAVAMALMGRSGAQMLPFMRDLAEQGVLVARVTADEAAAADNYEKTLVKLSASQNAWKRELALGLLPVMDGAAQSLNTMVSATGGLRSATHDLKEDGSLRSWAEGSLSAISSAASAVEMVARYLKLAVQEVLMVSENIGYALDKMRIYSATASGVLSFSGASEMLDRLSQKHEWAVEGIMANMANLLNAGETAGERFMANYRKIATDREQAVREYQQAVAAIVSGAYDPATLAATLNNAAQAYGFGSKSRVKFGGDVSPQEVGGYEKALEAMRKLRTEDMLLITAAEGVKQTQSEKALAVLQSSDAWAKLTVAQQKNLVAQYQTNVGIEKELQLRDEERKRVQEVSKAYAQQLDHQVQANARLDEQIKKQLEENETIGLTAEQLREVKLAQADRTATEMEAQAEMYQMAAFAQGMYNPTLLATAEALRIAAAKTRELAQVQANGELARAATDGSRQLAQSFGELYNGLEQGMVTALTSGTDAGLESADQSIKAWLAKMASQMVMRMVVQPIFSQVAGSMGVNMASLGGQWGSAASGGGASLLSNAGNIFSVGKGIASLADFGAAGYGSMFEMASAGTGTLGGLIGNGITGLGNAIGSSTIADAGVSMAAGEGLMGAIGTAMPYLAIAMALYSIFGSSGGGPKTEGSGMVSLDSAGAATLMSQWGNSDAHNGSMEFTGAADAGVQTAAMSYGKAAGSFLKSLGVNTAGYQFGLGTSVDPMGDDGDWVHAAGAINGKSFYNAEYEGERDKGAETLALEEKRLLIAAVQASDVPAILKTAIGNAGDIHKLSDSDATTLMTNLQALADGMKTLNGPLKDAADAFKGTTAEAVAYVQSLSQIQAFSDADPFATVAASTKSLFMQWRDDSTALKTLATSGTASVQQLAAASQTRYQQELQLAQQITAAVQATKQVFADAMRGIQMSALDNKGKYEFLDKEIVRERAALAQSTDAAEIQQIAGKLASDMTQAYGLLSPEEQRAKNKEFLTDLQELDALTQQQLAAAKQALQDQHKADADLLAAALAPAATTMQTAADNMVAAANTPVKVSVSVNSSTPEVSYS